MRKFNKKKLPSRHTSLGADRAPHRSFYYAMGETEKDVSKPFVGVVSTWNEAAKNAYQFAWHSYCDWYIELSKTILFADDEKSKKEVKEVSAYIFKQILVILHPFIPFVTEKIWLKNKFDKSDKNFLMHANWPSGKAKKDQSMKDVESIINVISELRSFKNELNVSPGSFIDISVNNIAHKN